VPRREKRTGFLEEVAAGAVVFPFHCQEGEDDRLFEEVAVRALVCPFHHQEGGEGKPGIMPFP